MKGPHFSVNSLENIYKFAKLMRSISITNVLDMDKIPFVSLSRLNFLEKLILHSLGKNRRNVINEEMFCQFLVSLLYSYTIIVEFSGSNISLTQQSILFSATVYQILTQSLNKTFWKIGLTDDIRNKFRMHQNGFRLFRLEETKNKLSIYKNLRT